MRPRTLIGDVKTEMPPTSRPDTYEHVRRTLDEALAELQLPILDRDDSGLILKVPAPSVKN